MYRLVALRFAGIPQGLVKMAVLRHLNPVSALADIAGFPSVQLPAEPRMKLIRPQQVVFIFAAQIVYADIAHVLCLLFHREAVSPSNLLAPQ